MVLDHTPVSDQHIEVFVDGILWTDWTYDATVNTVYFTVIPPEKSLIEVVYTTNRIYYLFQRNIV